MRIFYAFGLQNTHYGSLLQNYAHEKVHEHHISSDLSEGSDEFAHFARIKKVLPEGSDFDNVFFFLLDEVASVLPISLIGLYKVMTKMPKMQKYR